VEDLDDVAERHVHRDERRARRGVGLPTRRLHEEVEQHRVAVRRDDQHEAPGPETGEEGLGHEGSEHRPDRRVHGVAAGAEHVRAGVGRGRVARGDDAAHVAGLQ